MRAKMQLLEVVTGHSQFLSDFSIPQAMPTQPVTTWITRAHIDHTGAAQTREWRGQRDDGQAAVGGPPPVLTHPLGREPRPELVIGRRRGLRWRWDDGGGEGCAVCCAL